MLEVKDYFKIIVNKKNCVYKSKVKSEGTNFFYIRATQNFIKRLISKHIYKFKKRNKYSSTSLSKFIWDLKDKINFLCGAENSRQGYYF